MSRKEEYSQKILILFLIALFYCSSGCLKATSIANRPKATKTDSYERCYPLAPSPISQLKSDGIRAVVYSDPAKAKAAGFNLMLPWATVLTDSRKTVSADSEVILSREDISEVAVESLRDWALKCKKNDLIMMYMLYVGNDYTVRHLTGKLVDHLAEDSNATTKAWPAHQYRRVVDWDGNRAHYAPCPLERKFWNGFIRPQLELVATVLKETGAVGGGALELETYQFASIYPGYSTQKKSLCYCEGCFYGFVRSLGNREKLPQVRASKRFDWLTQHGSLPKYEKYLEDEMAQQISEMLVEVRKINPDFVFGFYPYTPFWYYDALIRGGGTPQLPCLLFSSSEYKGGYTTGDPKFNVSGMYPTSANITHLRHRSLHAMYAGGLYDKGMRSPDAVAMAMDRMLRGLDGYWFYHEYRSSKLEPFWIPFPSINQWTTNNPGLLPLGKLQDITAVAAAFAQQNKRDGIKVSNGLIEAYYNGQARKIRIAAGGFDDKTKVAEAWQGRGALPSLDKSSFHSGRASIRFDPSAVSEGPRSPYIDQKVPEAAFNTLEYELSFWLKTSDNKAPIRFWVSRASSSQYPAYMRYTNYLLPANQDWKHIRTPIDYKPKGKVKGETPLVIRFWCPPTEGKVWLDDVKLQCVQSRIIDIPLSPPAGASGWGAVDWKLSPSDARCDAEIVDPNDQHVLRMRLYPGDSLAPLKAIRGLEPVLLRLRVYPSETKPVMIQNIWVGFTFDSP